MRSITMIQAVLLVVILSGCKRQVSQVVPQDEEGAVEIARQLREAITEPGIMQLDLGRETSTSLRGLRQQEVGRPFMCSLVAFGVAAEEPLRKLLNDDDESVRRSCAGLIQQARNDVNSKPQSSEIIISLHIPVLEYALTSNDAEIRQIACDSLGNFSNWDEVCFGRLMAALPELRKLKDDGDQRVRGIAWTASNSIAAAVSTRSRSSVDREAAAGILKQLESENRWE